MRVLAVDPGEKRIGLAISDPTGMVSRPLCVIKHDSRKKDAIKIVDIAKDQDVRLIVVGWALDAMGDVGHQARKSLRLAEAIRKQTDLPVNMWDETGTTQAAMQSRIDMGVSRKKRKGHLDAVAANILLQDYLINNDIHNERDEALNG